jgi:glucokinase
MKKVYLGIDWGGTRLKFGLFENDKLTAKYKFASPELSHPDKFFVFIKDVIKDALAKNGYSRSDVQGAGIGIPGLLNVTEGFIYYLPNIKGWEDFRFRDVFEREVGIPIVMDNDANVAGLSEFKRGSAVGYTRGIVFTLGTGLGAGLVLDGKLYTGDCSSAEAGHMPIALNGKRCGCSSHGCIETFVGARHFVAHVKQIMKKKKSSMRAVKDLTPEDIYKAAVKGDAVALEAWEYFGEVFGRFSAGLVNLLDLQVIVLSGGISGAFKFFAPKMTEAIKRHAMRPLGDKVAIKKAKLSSEAGLYGAYELIREVESRKRILFEYSRLLKIHGKV